MNNETETLATANSTSVTTTSYFPFLDNETETLATANSTSLTTTLPPRNSTAATTILTFVLFFGSFIFIVNSAVFIILLTNKKLRSGNHTFIFISLSFSDAMLGVSLVVISAETVFSLTNGVFCPVWLHLAVLSTTTSLCQALAICIDRFGSMHKELKYQNLFCGKKKYIATITVWLINIVYFLVVFLSLEENQKVRVCSDTHIFGSHLRLYKILQGLIILPVYILTIVFYIKMILQLRRRITAIEQNVGPGGPTPGSHTHKYLTSSVKTISIVVIALLILTGPFVIEICVEILANYKITDYVKFAPIFNAIANPVVYLWRLKDFRMAISCGHWA